MADIVQDGLTPIRYKKRIGEQNSPPSGVYLVMLPNRLRQPCIIDQVTSTLVLDDAYWMGTWDGIDQDLCDKIRLYNTLEFNKGYLRLLRDISLNVIKWHDQEEIYYALLLGPVPSKNNNQLYDAFSDMVKSVCFDRNQQVDHMLVYNNIFFNSSQHLQEMATGDDHDSLNTTVEADYSIDNNNDVD